MELALRDSRFLSALRLTFITATISMFILFVISVPTAYAIARINFSGKSFLLSLVDLPIIIPQSAAGIAILHVFGRKQIIGSFFADRLGIPVDGTVAGIIIAQIFVALPFLLRSAVIAFETIDEELELTARSLGASAWRTFYRIAIPLASRGIFLGSILAWARAAGEFGAVIFVAPAPETAPVFVYNNFNISGIIETKPMVSLLLFFSLAMFFLLQCLTKLLSKGSYSEGTLTAFFSKDNHTSAISQPYVSSYINKKIPSENQIRSVLETNNLMLKLGDFTLGPISIEIKTNDYLFIVGRSGCGKTTLLKVIAGFLKPDSGEIKLSGKNAISLPPEKRNIGYVSQTVSLFPHLSVEENVKFGLLCRNIEQKSLTSEFLSTVELTGITYLLKRMPNTLSGGEKRRVAIARALAVNPVILLLDEPLSMLDFEARSDLMKMLNMVHLSGIPIIHVTHHPEEIIFPSAKILKMDSGKITI